MGLFVGCIGVGSVSLIPTPMIASARDDNSGATSTLVLSPPAGVQVGDVMVACYGGGAYSGGGGPYTFTPDPSWTPIYNLNDSTTHQVITNLFYKIANAADAAGTSSYSWTLTTGTIAGHALTYLAWPSRHGDTFGGTAATYTDPPASLTSPGGRWQLVLIYQRTASAFGQPDPNPVVTSAGATLLHANTHVVGSTNNARAGVLRMYASERVSPITGAYLTGGINFPRQGMVVAAVST